MSLRSPARLQQLQQLYRQASMSARQRRTCARLTGLLLPSIHERQRLPNGSKEPAERAAGVPASAYWAATHV
eukprot:12404425-Alexandrium_andersonii.AAC.1